MNKLVLLTHDDDRGGGSAHLTHPGSILEIMEILETKDSAVGSVMDSAGLFNTDFLHMIISFGFG